MKKHGIICIILCTLSSCNLLEEVMTKLQFHPPQVKHSVFNKNSLSLSWKMKKNAEKILGYRLLYETDNDTPRQKLLSPTLLEKTFKLTPLIEGKQYRVRIQAVYSNFYGPWSKVIEGTTGKPLPVDNFEVKSITDTNPWHLKLHWKKNIANNTLKIVEHNMQCWNIANPKKTESHKISTKEGKIVYKEQNNLGATKGTYVCEVQSKTDKSVVSDIIRAQVEVGEIATPQFTTATTQAWSSPISFAIVAEHSYTLQVQGAKFFIKTSDTPLTYRYTSQGNLISLVTLTENTNLATIHSTGPVSSLTVIATRTGYYGERKSASVTFTQKTGTASITPPAFNSTSTAWGSSISFPKVPDHAYIPQATSNLLKTSSRNNGTTTYTYRPPQGGPFTTVTWTENADTITTTADGPVPGITILTTHQRYTGQKSSSITFTQKTGTAGITPPAFNSTSTAWGSSISFPKVSEHAYIPQATSNLLKTSSRNNGTTTYTYRPPQGGPFTTVTWRENAGTITTTADGPVPSITILTTHQRYTGQKSSSITFTQKTGTAGITPPAFNSTSTAWGSSISFPKVPEHAYTPQATSNLLKTSSRNNGTTTYTYRPPQGGPVTTVTWRENAGTITTTADGPVPSITILTTHQRYTGQKSSSITFTQKTGTASITPPAFNSTSTAWGSSISFPKVPDHAYTPQATSNLLKTSSRNNDTTTYTYRPPQGGPVTTVTWRENAGTITTTADGPVPSITILTTHQRYTGQKSSRIAFTKQEGTRLSFRQPRMAVPFRIGNKYSLQVPTRANAKDTGAIMYTAKPSTGVTITNHPNTPSMIFVNPNPGIKHTITITATKKATAKYKESKASYELEITPWKKNVVNNLSKVEQITVHNDTLYYLKKNDTKVYAYDLKNKIHDTSPGRFSAIGTPTALRIFKRYSTIFVLLADSGNNNILVLNTSTKTETKISSLGQQLLSSVHGLALCNNSGTETTYYIININGWLTGTFDPQSKTMFTNRIYKDNKELTDITTIIKNKSCTSYISTTDGDIKYVSNGILSTYVSLGLNLADGAVAIAQARVPKNIASDNSGNIVYVDWDNKNYFIRVINTNAPKPQVSTVYQQNQSVQSLAFYKNTIYILDNRGAIHALNELRPQKP